MKRIESLLEHQRKKQLDTSRRNPLLNYRITSKAIEITSEWPQDIFRHLVFREKTLTFLHKIDEEDGQDVEIIQGYIDDINYEEEIDIDYQIDDEELNIAEFQTKAPYIGYEINTDEKNKPSSHINALKDTLGETYRRLINKGKLPTNHTTVDLKSRLKNIYRDMQRFNRELGINPYYLTLGVLEWADPKRSQETNLAPILLIPVEITQKNRFSKFELRYTDEEVKFNETLHEKLSEDFGIQLPLQNIVNPHDIQEYFALIEETVKEYKWRVDRTKLTLAIFASKKFLMHKDLQAKSWPEGSSPEKNLTLNKLLHGEGQATWHSPFQRTHLVDSIVSPMNFYQIYDADSSQLMAIYHVQKGQDLIIQGPPGTGKSQTITNIVAQAIGDEKTVLFVAQKETALNVVKGKLNEAGLGQLCLELHGHKTKRRAFLNDLQQTLDHSSHNQIEQQFGNIPELVSVRDKLNKFCGAINTSIDGENVTPFRCFEELLRLKDVIQNANPPTWPNTNLFNEVGSIQYHEWLPKIENLQRLLAEIGLPQDNVFRFCQYSDGAFISPEQTIQIIRQANTALGNLT